MMAYLERQQAQPVAVGVAGVKRDFKLGARALREARQAVERVIAEGLRLSAARLSIETPALIWRTLAS